MMKLLSIGFTVAVLALTGAAWPAQAKDNRLPCGDYDGAPSHNDCRPLSPALQAKCEALRHQIDSTFGLNPDQTSPPYIAAKANYKSCVFSVNSGSPAQGNPQGNSTSSIKVLKDTDVFDKPDGKGKRIGMLSRGTQGVSVNCRHNWCDTSWPAGSGWVYNGPDYRSFNVH